MEGTNLYLRIGMKKLFMFSYNHSPYFIERVWGEDSNLTSHLMAKFSGIMDDKTVTDPNAILRFISELDADNQDKLFNYIIENH